MADDRTMTDRRRRILTWAAGVFLAAFFVFAAIPQDTRGIVTGKEHHEARGVQWPVCERWFLRLRTDGWPHRVLVEVTQADWDAAREGDRWPRY